MSKKKRLQGVIAKARNGHIIYEIKKAKPSFMPLLLELLKEEFSAGHPENEETFVSSVSGDIEVEKVKLGYGWDDFTGVYILSLCEQGDALVQALASKINNRLKKVNYSDFSRM